MKVMSIWYQYIGLLRISGISIRDCFEYLVSVYGIVLSIRYQYMGLLLASGIGIKKCYEYK